MWFRKKTESEIDRSLYIEKYRADIDKFVNASPNLKNKYNRYLEKARFQSKSFDMKFFHSKPLSQTYTIISIVTSVFLLTLIMPNSFNSLLGGSGDLFPHDSIVYNILKICTVIIFSISSNLNLFSRPDLVKDVMRRKLIQLNSLLEDTSTELLILSPGENEEKVLRVIDNAFRKLVDVGYDGIDVDINVEDDYY